MLIGFNSRGLCNPNLRGGQRYTFCLLKALQNHAEIQVKLFTEHRSPMHPFYGSFLNFHTIELRSPKVLWWEQVLLPRALKRHRVTVFHAPAEAGLPAMKVCKYVLTYHGIPEEGLGYLIRKGELTGNLGNFLDDVDLKGFEGWYLRRRFELLRSLYIRTADIIITVSEFSKRELCQFLAIPPDKIRVVYNGADETLAKELSLEEINQVRGRYGIPSAYALFVGGYDRHKNAASLVRIFAELKRMKEDVALVLVGIGGPVSECKALAAQLGMQENRDVFFLAEVPDTELRALYRGAKLFVTLAWHEGFCMPAVEAMACGVPVVASSFGALPEIIADGGILVDPRDTRQVLAAIRGVLDHPEMQAGLRMKALQRAKSFSWKRAAKETLEVYNEVTGNPRASHG